MIPEGTFAGDRLPNWRTDEKKSLLDVECSAFSPSTRIVSTITGDGITHTVRIVRDIAGRFLEGYDETGVHIVRPDRRDAEFGFGTLTRLPPHVRTNPAGRRCPGIVRNS